MSLRVRVASARVAVLFGAFVLLGLPEGVLGTAWPSIRGSFDRPEAALAQLLIAHTIGYLISTALLGRVVARLGGNATIRTGIIMTAIGLFGYAAAPAWPMAIVAAGVLGLGGGTVDAAVNAEIALHHGPRTMNLLHAAFGVGATLGPLMVTAVLGIDVSWRLVYATLLFIELGLLAVFVQTIAPDAHAARESIDPARPPATTVARPNLVLGVTLMYFALYVGAEVSIGSWSYSVLTEDRGVSATTAGIAVAGYWGGLTLGRLVLGVVGDRLDPMVALRGSAVVSLLSMGWFAVGGAGSIVALALLGASFAGIFPALVLLTARWLPTEQVTRAVGWQLAASSAGAIATSAVLGVVTDRAGLDATVIAIAVVVVAMGGAHSVIELVSR